MRSVITSRIMRTTIDLDPTVVKELKVRSKGAGKSMGQLASELLAKSLREQEGRPADAVDFEWIARDLGRPLVDLEDKEAVRGLLDGHR
jgi:plasmid stability protein